MLYFAYGSNMKFSQMKERCPSASFLCFAELINHTLAFTRESTNRKCGVADVIPCKKTSVWGVIYLINEVELGALDKSEGFNPNREENAYIRKDVMVFGDGQIDQPFTAMTYVVQKKSDYHIPPSKDYLNLIISGAEMWHLPSEYIQKLLKIEVEG